MTNSELTNICASSQSVEIFEEFLKKKKVTKKDIASCAFHAIKHRLIAEESIAKIKKEVDEMNKAYPKKIANYKEQIASLNTCIKGLKNNIKGLEDTVKSLHNQVHKQSDVLKDKDMSIASHKEKIDEMQHEINKLNGKKFFFKISFFIAMIVIVLLIMF